MKWSHVSHRSGMDQGKSVSQRPTATPPVVQLIRAVPESYPTLLTPRHYVYAVRVIRKMHVDGNLLIFLFRAPERTKNSDRRVSVIAGSEAVE